MGQGPRLAPVLKPRDEVTDHGPAQQQRQQDKIEEDEDGHAGLLPDESSVVTPFSAAKVWKPAALVCYAKRSSVVFTGYFVLAHSHAIKFFT